MVRRMTSPDSTVADMLADLDAIKPGAGGRFCRTGAAVASLPAEVQEGYQALEARPMTTNTALAAFLNKWAPGYDLSEGNVGHHRRRGKPNGCKACARDGAAS